jgi:AcrR family transcriptional regulator
MNGQEHHVANRSSQQLRARSGSAVSVESFGVAGPAVYRYFVSKADILSALIIRVQEWKALESSRATHHSASDEQVIEGLVRGYVRIATEATDLLAVSVTEALNLPASAAERNRRVRQDDLAEWVKWLRISRSEVTEADALALVNAVRTALNDLVRIPHLSRHAEFPDELVACSLNALRNTPMPSARSGRRRDE